MRRANNESDPQGAASGPELGLNPAASGYGPGGGSYLATVGGGRGGAPNDQFGLLNILRILLRRWHTVALTVVLGILAAIVYYMYAPRMYAARADLEMRVRRPKVINNEAIFDESGNPRDTDAIFNTRFAKFRSPAMEKLATKEYLSRYPSYDIPGITKYTLPYHIGEAHWSKDSKADIVRVVYEHSNPVFAARLVNVLSHCAGVLMMEENRAMSDEAVAWLVSQVEEQRLSLEEMERELAKMRDELHLDSLEQRKAVLNQSLISVSEEREQLISSLAAKETILEFIESLRQDETHFEVLPAGLPKEEQLNELIRAWRTAKDELSEAGARYTDVHPAYRTAADKEARARQRLEQFIELSARSVRNEINLLKRQIEQMSKRIDSMETEAQHLEQQLVVGRQQLQRLERKRDAADNAYQSILRRMEEARLSADENMAYTKVIRDADTPTIPTSPKQTRVMAAGVVLGGLAGCLIALLLELSRDRVATITDLKNAGLNVLCTIPHQKKIDSRGQLATMGLRDKFSPIVEIFAGMNALISSDRFIQRSRMLLVTSILPGEGKTIATCNMAVSSALNGTRTLLVDGDLRRPQLVNVFAIDEDHPSLLEWLSNEKNDLRHDDLIAHNIIENLDVITSRPLKDINPAELLGRRRLGELLEWAREHYDRVIIDSPPLGPVGDAQVLANQADSVVLVSRIGKTRKRGLRFAMARFDEIGVPVLGCIANDVPNSLTGMFGGGEGYGYSYGYGGYKSQDAD